MKMTATAPARTITPTKLTDNWHPGYLIAVADEPKPETFTLMKGDRVYRWFLCVWEDEEALERGDPPELQDAVSSTVFNEKSKSWKWTKNLLGVACKVGDSVEWEHHLPRACFIRGEPTTKEGETDALFSIEVLDRATPGFAKRPVPAVVVLAMKKHAGDPDDIPDPHTPVGTLPPGDDDIPL